MASTPVTVSSAILAQLDASLHLVETMSSSLSSLDLIVVRQRLGNMYATMGVILNERDDVIAYARKFGGHLSIFRSSPFITANPGLSAETEITTQAPVTTNRGATLRGTGVRHRRRRIVPPPTSSRPPSYQQSIRANPTNNNGTPGPRPVIYILSDDESSTGKLHPTLIYVF